MSQQTTGTMPRVVGIIPARYASTRLPGKPLVRICGTPMIQRVCERVRTATLLNEIIVATDHQDIFDAVEEIGGTAIMTPADLRSGSDRIAFVARTLPKAELIVNIQGDEPLIAPTMIDQAIKPLVDDASIQVGTLIKRIGSAQELMNPNIVKVVVDHNQTALYFSRSPIPFFRDNIDLNEWHIRHEYFKHIGLYVYRREALLAFASWEESILERAEKLEQLRFLEHGYQIHATVTEHDSISVDTLADVERVEHVLNHQSAGHAR